MPERARSEPRREREAAALVLVVLIGRHQALVVFQKLDVSFSTREELLFQATFNWEREAAGLGLVVVIRRHQTLVRVFQKLDVSFSNREELLFQAIFN
jgi:hypothetical protein